MHAVHDQGGDLQHVQDCQAGPKEHRPTDAGELGLDDGPREQVDDRYGLVMLGPDLDTALI